MENLKIGFLGCGNMASAMISGLVNSQALPAKNILVFDRKPKTNSDLHDKFGVTAMSSAEQLAQTADYLIAAVKPNVLPDMLKKLSAHLRQETVIVSVAAGVTLATLASALPQQQKIVRVMPNTPCLVGEGMSSITPNDQVTEEETETVVTLFSRFGKAEVVSESLIHAVVGVSGSAPAYIYILIEAMADAAVLGGMPRAKAYQFAAQAVKGSAEMVLESGKHPGELKDNVCSPGGTTIEAVAVLEETGFRSSIMQAMQACIAKSDALSKK
ncbi:pyrroline-5-carboxylate reductase [Rosenbergiella australiborealis]|uniref:Pyrroline-5-carboxylate reductase n=1 Tax=Rosenbergiella australiborealis TaxID=1544696 RepID=A0ABS5T6S9_9GAMM|nr:pyrroline-5-carboxylate reductase [Rosenbergiella australiborealis]MBT0728060.1 pyrroline-5-carboxylate reductase [Rosenbergiella australiborealis]